MHEDLGLPWRKRERGWGSKIKSLDPKVKPLKAALSEKVSPEERKLKYRKFEIYVLSSNTKEDGKDNCTGYVSPMPQA